jgi:hypothetical protein
MTHKIDLHGLTHDKAVRKLEYELIGISLQKHYDVEIITGKSSTMQEKIIKEVLEPQSFFYYIPTENRGMIMVCDNDLFN